MRYIGIFMDINLFVKIGNPNQREGGYIYVHNKHQFKIRNDLSTFVEGENESIFIEILSKTYKALIGVIYRIPNISAEISLM